MSSQSMLRLPAALGPAHWPLEASRARRAGTCRRSRTARSVGGVEGASSSDSDPNRVGGDRPPPLKGSPNHFFLNPRRALPAAGGGWGPGGRAGLAFGTISHCWGRVGAGGTGGMAAEEPEQATERCTTPPTPHPCPLLGKRKALLATVTALGLNVIRLLSRGTKTRVDALLEERGLHLPEPGDEEAARERCGLPWANCHSSLPACLRLPHWLSL